MKPLLLDLFCGAGGCTKGYRRAGFHVVGVDNRPMPRYCGDEFEQADAVEDFWRLVDHYEPLAIHASPPCQAWSALGRFPRDYPELIEPIRELLLEWGGVYVIENVPGAPLRAPLQLCGSSFGLDVRRHRLFESNLVLLGPPCQHGIHTPRFPNMGTRRRAVLSSVVGVYGRSHFKGDNLAYRSAAMEIDWMQMDELSEAIPPVYAEIVGFQLLGALRGLQTRSDAYDP